MMFAAGFALQISFAICAAVAAEADFSIVKIFKW
jgi:hypothetical protein